MAEKQNYKYISRWCLFLFLAFIVLSLNGCALLAIPGQLIGGVFKLLGQIIGVIDKLPKPPPWVFI